MRRIEQDTPPRESNSGISFPSGWCLIALREMSKPPERCSFVHRNMNVALRLQAYASPLAGGILSGAVQVGLKSPPSVVLR